ncbi:Heterogeneous nuclear ribonucleoprotein L-like [Takifugu flavidus]|uniref:Heterogeneous nuclear ribonucleoprotein L-like n=1 Tax=Takifugu flavidus TaxID=433684 RepID=A0A5C6MI76_9TELE|nr:Heterogeneous nuclear ribonucleoprotein L-like [Takifugu flavidus]
MSAAAAPPHSDGEDEEEYRRPSKRLKTAVRQTEEREEGEDELEEGEDSDSGSLPGEGEPAVDHRARGPAASTAEGASQVTTFIPRSPPSYPGHQHHTQVTTFIPRSPPSYPGHQHHSQVTNIIARSPHHSQVTTFIPGHHLHTQVTTFIPRSPTSYPGHQPHTQVTTFIPRSPTSYPGHQHHTQVTSIIPRSPPSYPGHHLHTQVTNLIPSHQHHSQVTNIIPRSPASYPGHHLHTQVTNLIPSTFSSTFSRTMEDNDGDSHRISPSPVVHVRGLCEAVVEADLIDALEKFGPICYVMMMPFKRQALVEFSELQSADRCVSCGAKEPVYIAGQQAYFNYSTSKRITRPTNADNPNSGNKVLLLSIQNPLYPITTVTMATLVDMHMLMTNHMLSASHCYASTRTGLSGV